jgi:hypothetical protein
LSIAFRIADDVLWERAMTKKSKDKINFEKRKFQTSSMAKILPGMLKKLGASAEAGKSASLVRVIHHWPEIIGTEIAAKTLPVKIIYKKQKNRDTGEQESIRVLKLKAESALVTAIAMREAIICQRLNTLFGAHDFKKLDIEHGFISSPTKATPRKDNKSYALDLPDIEDPILKERLESLGQAVMNSAQK